MNLYESQEFFKQMYPGKSISYEFDERCHRTCECIITDGNPNIMHHIECNKVKVTIQGMPAQYVPIAPHRMTVSWSEMKKMLVGKTDLHMTPDQVKELKSLKDKKDPSYQEALNQWVGWSGLLSSQIEEKLS